MKSKKENNEKPDINKVKTDSVAEEELFLEDQDLDPEKEEPQIIPEEEEQEEVELTLEEQINVLTQSLEEMEAKADEYLDGWQRSRAEFANYKKRVIRENADIHQVARGEIIKLYLDIADDLERALLEKPEHGEDESWADGIEIIFQKLHARLEAEGIKPMNAMGEVFDPNIHEALMKEENEEFESGQIIEVMQEGYWIGEKVLRPALVRVAA